MNKAVNKLMIKGGRGKNIFSASGKERYLRGVGILILYFLYGGSLDIPKCLFLSLELAGIRIFFNRKERHSGEISSVCELFRISVDNIVAERRIIKNGMRKFFLFFEFILLILY
ncbi:hypothetical protein [Mesocricetibacter intestinalis]|uniref:hypothetical protein n=1 Tax=Mesocricetibacter intestinalis TaxID=1521930 RepID=UPI00105C9918|nr:hypothetical protein [Mesocricetibacter intestinalis]